MQLAAAAKSRKCVSREIFISFFSTEKTKNSLDVASNMPQIIF